MPRETIATRVERGAALLDRHVPGWEKRIDLETLDIASSEFCICGQLANKSRAKFVRENLGYPGEGFGVFIEYLDTKRKPKTEMDAVWLNSGRYGFSGRAFSRLTKAWKALIEERVSE
jgi:hypothetical protein